MDNTNANSLKKELDGNDRTNPNINTQEGTRLDKGDKSPSGNFKANPDYYKMIFEHYRFCSDWRTKTIKGWCYMFAAVVAAFTWSLQFTPKYAFIPPLFGFFATGFIWAADYRHREGHGGIMEAGWYFEEEQNMSKGFFRKVYNPTIKGPWYRHGVIINYFAVFFLCLFVALSGVTFWINGKPAFLSEAIIPPKTQKLIIEVSTNATDYIPVLRTNYSLTSTQIFRIRLDPAP